MAAMRRAVAVLALASACASVDSGAGAGRETIDGRYSAQAVRWREDAGVIFVFRAFEQDGRVALCGAYLQIGEAPYGSSDILPVTVRHVGVRLDGETLAHGLSFFNALPPDAQPLGKEANRRLTDVAWRPAFAGSAPDLHVDQRSFRFRP